MTVLEKRGQPDRGVRQRGAYLVGGSGEERQRHGALGRAGAQLLRHVRQAVPKSSSLVDDSLSDELTLPPLIVSSGPPEETDYTRL